MSATTKPLVFMDSSLDDLRDFPRDVRRAIGEELRRVQLGLMPNNFKSMSGVGAGVYELRIRLEGAWRVLYVAKFTKAIYVLHAFQKTTQQTAQADIVLASKRYRKLIGG